MWFTRISIGNPVLATMMMMAFVVLGLFSYKQLRVDQFPDVTFPVVVVQTDYPGASPETVESDVSRKIEEAVNTISGINALTSRSYEGSSIVIIEFDLTVNPAQAAQDVREKVALIKSAFRKEVKEPRVTRYDPADLPIFSISIANEPGTAQQRSLRELTTIADQVVKKRLENARGVGSVTLVGGVRREIDIYVKPNEMEALGVGVDEVVRSVKSENQELPTGAIRSQSNETVVQIQGRIKNPEDFARIIVARRGGQPVTLAQVAKVVDGQEERETLALYNGQRTLALNILKAQGQNTIDVADALTSALTDLQPTIKALYPGVKIDVIKDSARQIRVGVKNVRRTLIEGAALTILIVFLFLNSWRSTVITGLTLPVALLGTFLFMYMFGFTINTITLMALSLCVGLLIDDAIVVRENIVRHAGMRSNGRYKTHREAALEGTAEIGLAVLATTFSIVAVFLPVGFMGGIIGRFFHQFGVTVTAAVLISMFVSFTLDPMLSSIWPDPDVHRADGTHGGKAPLRNWYDRSIGPVLGAFSRFVDRLSAFYQRLLKWSLDHRKSTLAIAVGSFVIGLTLPASGLIGSEFVPQADYSETGVTFFTPVGSSLEFTEAKVRQVESVLREFPEVRDIYSTVNTGNAAGKSYATVFIRLTPRDERIRTTAQMSIPMRARLTRIAGITVTQIGSLDGVGGDSKQIRFSLMGPDLNQLARLSEQVQTKLRGINGVVDIDSSLKAQKPTISVTPKRDLAADLGVGVQQLGDALRPLLAGEAASSWRAPDDENYDVNVRLSPTDRNNVAALSRLMLSSTQTNTDGSPRMVALRQIATIAPTFGASQINRRDLNREVELSANVVGRSPGQASTEIRKMLDAVRLQPGYRYTIGGSTKSMNESAGYALSALLLAVIFIYMILASQFASFLQPVAIMSALPLTLIGVFLALMLFHSTLNIFSIIGFIMLMGLVTKNAILLVDFTNQVRKTGVPRYEALLEAAHVRLRPILMTTLAMVFGMVPLAFGLAEGSEQRAPMGQAVIGGIITSSLLTLVVVPVIYTYLDDFGAWLGRKWHRSTAAPVTAPGLAAPAKHGTAVSMVPLDRHPDI